MKVEGDVPSPMAIFRAYLRQQCVVVVWFCITPLLQFRVEMGHMRRVASRVCAGRVITRENIEAWVG